MNQEKRAMVGDLAEGLSIEIGKQLKAVSFLDLFSSDFDEQDREYHFTGLNISKRIIEGHRGKISCSSQPGRETIFSFSILQ